MRLYILFSFTIASLLSAAGTSYAQADMFESLKDSSKYKNVVVQKVISVNTIVIEDYLKNGETIRLIGLKSPGSPKKKKSPDFDEHGFPIKEIAESPMDPLEDQAFEFVEKLLRGKRIRLEFDIKKTDENHKTFAYIFLLDSDMFVNSEILRQGFAELQVIQPNTKYDAQLKEAYQEARKEKRGVHNQ